MWLCNIHNMVNVRLKKPIYPCEDVDSHYDCGCNLESEDESEASFDLPAVANLQHKPAVAGKPVRIRKNL